MKILICFGTRPEAIKMAPLIKELKRSELEFLVCVTGQHREMLDQVLQFFEIIPDYDLNLMEKGQSLNSLSSSILNSVDSILEKENPNLILVQGDTTTAFICALAAFNRKIKIGHIEAGLRTYDKTSPYPEEGNRQLIGRIANYHFAPTESSRNNLLKEAIAENTIFITGNTVVDSLNFAIKRLNEGYDNEEIQSLAKVINSEKKLILVTGHRRENFGKGLMNLCEALLNISKNDDLQIVFPVHLNPEVKNLVKEELSNKKNIILIPPVKYPTFLWLLKQSTLIISDSGGIQEEAPSFNKSVIVTRRLTERLEGVNSGNSFITDSDAVSIENKVKILLRRNIDLTKNENPFGDGFAAKRIISILEDLNG